MRYTTTNIDQSVTENYPFGHRVNSVAGNVCWKLTGWQLWRTRHLARIHRAWVENADDEVPGEIHLDRVVSAGSTGARRATGMQFSRVSNTGRRSKNDSAPHSGWKPNVVNSLPGNANSANRMPRRSANSALSSIRARFVFRESGNVQDNRIPPLPDVMSIDRRNADTEKARSANSGPSRIDMSVVAVGTRSDSRQTA
jgi:hypothetical protein